MKLPDLKHLPLNVRIAARKFARLTLERRARDARVAAREPVGYPSPSDSLTLGTADRLPVIGMYTPPAPYRVFRVIRNPAAGSLIRAATRAALRVVKDES